MADGISIDFAAIEKLAGDFDTVSHIVGPHIRSAVMGTAGNIVRDTRKSVRSGDARWKALGGAVGYDVFAGSAFGGTVVQADVGYDHGGAGELGNVREYGTPRVAPHNDLGNALKANEADFEHGLEEAVADAQSVLAAGSSIGAAARAVIRGSFR